MRQLDELDREAYKIVNRLYVKFVAKHKRRPKGVEINQMTEEAMKTAMGVIHLRRWWFVYLMIAISLAAWAVHRVVASVIIRWLV